MSNINYVKKLTEQIANELGMDKAQNWLIKEVSLLLATYPHLADFIASQTGLMSLLDIIELFFEVECRKRKLDQQKIKGDLKSLAWEDLNKPRLENYLLSGIAVFLAFDYCFNHRYNKKNYIRWNIDYTVAYKHYLMSLSQHQLPSGKKSPTKRKFTF